MACRHSQLIVLVASLIAVIEVVVAADPCSGVAKSGRSIGLVSGRSVSVVGLDGRGQAVEQDDDIGTMPIERYNDARGRKRSGDVRCLANGGALGPNPGARWLNPGNVSVMKAITKGTGSVLPDTSVPVIVAGTTATVFKGLDYAGSGGSSVPPDQAICVGPTYLVEGANQAFAFFKKDGTRVRTYSLNSLFGVTNARGDPGCIYDADTGSFFLVTLIGTTQIGVAAVPENWNFVTAAKVFKVTYPATQLTDYPQIGIDAFSIWIATNQFSGSTFLGATLVGVDKFGLVASGTASLATLSLPKYGSAFNLMLATVRPQMLQPGSAADRNNGGTMYFLAKSIYATAEIVLCAVTLTSNIAKRLAIGPLLCRQITTSPAVVPSPLPRLTQQGGTTVTVNIDGRMQAAAYASGIIYGASHSSVAGLIGIGIYLLRPSVSAGVLSVTTIKTDILQDTGLNHLVFPAFGVSPTGRAILSFSYMGPTSYPSVGYVKVSSAGVASSGFTLVVQGTSAATANSRWGDYYACSYDATTAKVFCGVSTAYKTWSSWVFSVTP